MPDNWSVSMNPVPSPTGSADQPADWPSTAQHLLDTVINTVGWMTDRPWTGVIAASLAAAMVAGRSYWLRRRTQAQHRHAQLITITPPPQVDPDGAGVFWATMHDLLTTGWRRRWRDGRSPIALEYRWTGRQLTIALWVPGTVQTGPIRAAIRGAWPGAATTITPADPPLPADATTIGGALTTALPAWYPLNTDHDSDPMRTVIAAASRLNRTESAVVQILARPASRRQQRHLRNGVMALRTGQRTWTSPSTWVVAGLDAITGLFTATQPARAGATHRDATLLRADPQRDRDIRAAVDTLTGPQWEVAIRYAVANDRPRGGDSDTLRQRLTTIAHGIASAYGVWAGRNRLRRLRLRRPQTILAARPLRHGFLLHGRELASLAGLPTDLAVPGLSRARAKTMPAPVEVPSGGRGVKILGRAEDGKHSVALPVADARQHTHILGSTGSGKSTLMLNMILDDVHAGRGTIVIDPKGDLVTDVLDRIPASLGRKVVLIDPDQPGGATLNPLQGDDHDLVVDNIVSIFSRIFSKHWGPRIDDVLRVACLTLLRKANATLTLIPPLLNDRQFRHQFTADLDDPEGLRGFWEWFESTPPPLRAQVIGPVLSRLRAFLLRDFVRRTLGTPKSSFDMTRILDGGILLARLPKGQIGEETARLMGSFVLASAWQTATARIKIPEIGRRDSSAYIDECHNFLNLPGSVGDMLAEARGYRFGMVLAHQNLTQLPRDIQLALSANARNKVFFACAPEDAHQLARHTLPELDEYDLSRMDVHRAAARLVVDGKETAAFTLHTNPSRPIVGEATAVRQAATNIAAPVRTAAIAQLAGFSRDEQE
jgi:Type IV secretion-system coupling protein DNA-binding domain